MNASNMKFTWNASASQTSHSNSTSQGCSFVPHVRSHNILQLTHFSLWSLTTTLKLVPIIRLTAQLTTMMESFQNQMVSFVKCAQSRKFGARTSAAVIVSERAASPEEVSWVWLSPRPIVANFPLLLCGLQTQPKCHCHSWKLKPSFPLPK